MPDGEASAEAAWSGEVIASWLSEHQVLQRVNLGITDAVREQAANPLLHMAAFLRRPRQPPSAAATTTSVAAAATPPVPALVHASNTISLTAAPAPNAAAPAALASISGLLRPSSVDELSRLLREDGLDLSLWATAGAKSVRHLLAEINATECSLRQPAAGGLVREMTRVDIELILRGRVLVETHTQVGGRTLQRFKLLSVRLREGEAWQAGVRRMLKLLLRGLGDAPTAYSMQEGSHIISTSTRPAYSYPGLATECTRHAVTVVLDERSNLETLGIAGQDRFNTVEYPEAMMHVAVMSTRAGVTERLEPPLGAAAHGKDAVFKHHWAWYFQREWATIQRKLELDAARPPEGANGSGATGGADGGSGLRPCTDIRFDGVGDTQIVDDELGPEETQLRVLGQLYLGCEILWYHRIDGENSRAVILHIQAVDQKGVWSDPTICKLSPKDLLRAEADAHAVFARYIGESVPQRIGEPVYVDEIGGMVLELVGACWRMPELAHTQARHLRPSPPLSAHLRPSPPLHAILSPLRPCPSSTFSHLLAYARDRHTQATLSNTFAEVIKYDSDHAIEFGGPSTARDRPVFGEVRAVIDEVLLGQLSAVVQQTAHREPALSLFEYYGLLPKIKKLAERSVREDAGREGGGNSSSHFQIVKPSTLAALRTLQDTLTERGDVPDGPEGYPGPWFGIVHGDLHGGNIMVDSRSYAHRHRSHPSIHMPPAARPILHPFAHPPWCDTWQVRVAD